MDGGSWSVRFVLTRDAQGAPVLDFLAEHRLTSPRHARITGDGSVETFDAYLDHYVFNPATDKDEHAARRRMEEHNRRVSRELKRKGLL